jgi:uncharacterized tellurite resistance protein B-like protein
VAFFYRKSFKLGPLRVTASKSGLSTSVGLKGMRVTAAGPRGTYVTLSAGGFQYRKRVDSAPHTRLTSPPPSSSAESFAPSRAGSDASGYITTADVGTLAASSADDSLRDIQARVHGFDFFLLYLFLGGGVALLLAVLSTQVWPPLALIALTPFVVGGFPIYAWSKERRTARLIYDVDSPDLMERYAIAYQAGAALAASQVIWHIFYAVATGDRKRNAGASRLIQRTPVRCAAGSLPLIECNIEPFSVPVGPQQLLLLPDRLIVHQRGRFASVPYTDLRVDARTAEFVEEERVPGDSPHVRNTWRYVNKSGGPDRRFNDNRQIPVMLYGVLSLQSNSGMNVELQTSSPQAAEAAARALRQLAQPAPGPERASRSVEQRPHMPATEQRPYAPAWTKPQAAVPPQPGSRTEELATAVAVLLRSVAAADRRFDEREMALIGEALREVASNDGELQARLLGSVRQMKSGDDEVAAAAKVVRGAGPGAASRVVALARAVAEADGKVTAKERERLEELERTLLG